MGIERIIVLFLISYGKGCHGMELKDIESNNILNIVEQVEENDMLLPFQKLLHECREHNHILLFQTNMEYNTTSCGKVQYIANLLHLRKEITEGIDWLSTKPDFVKEEHINSMELLFTTYVLPHIPVMAQRDMIWKNQSDEEINEFISTCFKDDSTLLDFNCDTNILHRWHVPFWTMNDYLMRINTKFESDLFTASLVHVNDHPWQNCPYGSHLSVVALPGASLFFRLLPVKAVLKGVASELKNTVLDLLDLHAVLQSDQMNKQWNIDESESSTWKLLPGEALFVPADYLLQLHSDDNAENQSILRQCFVDASNFNSFQTSLMKNTLVSETHQSLLNALLHPNFNTEMSRSSDEHDRLWSNVAMWPKMQTAVKRGNRKERFKLWQEENKWNMFIHSLTLPLPYPPQLQNLHRRSLTVLFQDLYSQHDKDLTAYGYEISTYDATLSSRPLGVFETSHALHSKRYSITLLEKGTVPTSAFGATFDGFHFAVTIDVFLQPSVSYCFTVRVFSGETLGPESACSATATMLPMTPPSVLPGIPIISQTQNVFTLEWHLPTDDGGSELLEYAIDRKEVNGDKPEEAFFLKWTVDAILPSTILQECIPGRTYQFRVAAINAQGIGPWSPFSKMIHIPTSNNPLSELGHVHGRGCVVTPSSVVFELDGISGAGTESMYAAAGDENQIQSPKNSSSTIVHPMALLSDKYEKLTVDGLETFFVWASYYSPKLYNVTAEMVDAEPEYAEGPLRNAAEVANRLVFVKRGLVPFRTKALHAQAAGALGVIIADDGTCQGIFDQQCSPGADQSRKEGFAAQDEKTLWKNVRIPIVLLHNKDADQLVTNNMAIQLKM